MEAAHRTVFITDDEDVFIKDERGSHSCPKPILRHEIELGQFKQAQATVFITDEGKLLAHEGRQGDAAGEFEQAFQLTFFFIKELHDAFALCCKQVVTVNGGGRFIITAAFIGHVSPLNLSLRIEGIHAAVVGANVGALLITGGGAGDVGGELYAVFLPALLGVDEAHITIAAADEHATLPYAGAAVDVVLGLQVKLQGSIA